MEREINIRRPIKPDIPSFKRVAAYVRVSNLKDAMLQSLSTQVSYYNDFIQHHSGWQYAGVYVDEGLTGTKDLRPEFQRLLADCRGGKIDMIITKSTTRFARNTVTMLETVRMLKEFDVDVFFEKENIHSMSGDGELMLTILASFAQEESRSVSENCKWRLREKMKQGEAAKDISGVYTGKWEEKRIGNAQVYVAKTGSHSFAAHWTTGGYAFAVTGEGMNEKEFNHLLTGYFVDITDHYYSNRAVPLM